MANLYFLILMFAQCYPPISDTGGTPTILGPLIVVVGISMVKDAIEDSNRRTSDKEENNREC